MSEQATRVVNILARERDINARGRGADTYAMVGLPGSGRLVWADQVEGAEIRKDTYPRQRSNLAADRKGSQLVRVPLPLDTVIVYITKATDGRVERSAVRLTADGGQLANDGLAVRASTLPGAKVTQRRSGGEWITLVDGVEYR